MVAVAIIILTTVAVVTAILVKVANEGKDPVIINQDEKPVEIIEVNQVKSDSNALKGTDKIDKVGGWLAFFCFTLVLGALVSVTRVLSYGSINLSAYRSNPSIMSSLIFEYISIIISVGLNTVTWTFIGKRYKVAKYIAFVTFAYIIIANTISYIMAVNLLRSYGASPSPSAKGALTGSILYACFWAVYFLMSKRVEATLTETKKATKE